MGRKESKLIPFLKQALLDERYDNLRYEDIETQVFHLNFPRKKPSLERKWQYILRDYYDVTGREYRFNVDYSEGKQGMEAALKKSEFLLRLVEPGNKKKLIYRLLNDNEVKEKKSANKLLKALKKCCAEGEDCASSPQSSGYGSESDIGSVASPAATAFELDHDYYSKTAEVSPPEGQENNNNPHAVQQEECLLHQDTNAIFTAGNIDGNDCSMDHLSQVDIGILERGLEDILTDGEDLNRICSEDLLLPCPIDSDVGDLLRMCFPDLEASSLENDVSSLSGMFGYVSSEDGFHGSSSSHPFEREIEEASDLGVALVTRKIQYNVPTIGLEQCLIHNNTLRF